jgi:methyl-accepting chemotaxis protein
MSLKGKLVSTFFLMGLLPALTIVGITWLKNTDSLMDEASVKLKSYREIKAIEIETLFKTMQGQVRTLSANTLTVEAIKEFNKGFTRYASDSKKSVPSDRVEKSLLDFYNQQFGSQYKNVNNGNSPRGLAANVAALSQNGKALQYNYISANPNALGEKDSLADAEDGSAWSASHKKFHSSFKDYLYEFDYYDVFLVDIDSGNIIYSVFKELDFATSLKTGPYKNTGIGEAFNLSANATSKDFIGMTELGRYFPSYDAPAGFISSPVYDGDKKIGVLIFQLPVDKINAIMTSNKKWQETGFGTSGETYIIGKDKKMRSTSRFLVEDPVNYLDVMQSSMSVADLDYIKAKQTTIITQKIVSEGANAVIEGRTGFATFPDYRDVSVLSAYKPLNIEGLDWYLLAEMDEDEILIPLVKLRNLMLGILTFSAVIIGFSSTLFSKKLTAPINKLTEVMQHVEQSGDLSKRTEIYSEDEVGQIGRAFNSLMTSVEGAIKEVNSVMEGFGTGDFSNRVTLSLKGDLDSLKNATNHSVENVDTTMKTISEATSALGVGNFKKRMEGEFQGEYLQMQLNVNEAFSSLDNAITEINQVMVEVAKNDLTNRVDIELKGDLNLLKDAINQSIEGLSHTLVRIAGNTKQVATASSETSCAIGQISDGAQNQLHAMSQVAVAVKQSSQAVTEVAQDTASANKNATNAVHVVTRSQQKVDQMVAMVNVIASNSDKINKITEVIGGIANKTNMLSLNAAIEAARAGEHGAGFAVVAEEVRKLAEHSSNSASEITELVSQAVQDATKAVETAEEVRADMDAILEGSGSIEDKLRRIASAMEQQSATMHEITSNVDSMKSVAENSASASEEITATVVEVSRLADAVRNQIESFELVAEQSTVALALAK